MKPVTARSPKRRLIVASMVGALLLVGLVGYAIGQSNQPATTVGALGSDARETTTTTIPTTLPSTTAPPTTLPTTTAPPATVPPTAPPPTRVIVVPAPAPPVTEPEVPTVQVAQGHGFGAGQVGPFTVSGSWSLRLQHGRTSIGGMNGCSSTARVLTASGQPSGLDDFIVVDQRPAVGEATKTYTASGTFILKVTGICTLNPSGAKVRWDATVFD